MQEVDEDQDTNNILEDKKYEKNGLLTHDIAGDSFQREFELDDVYPYIKTGIASIIEDEVTQRFVAEELKVPIIIVITIQSSEPETIKTETTL